MNWHKNPPLPQPISHIKIIKVLAINLLYIYILIRTITHNQTYTTQHYKVKRYLLKNKRVDSPWSLPCPVEKSKKIEIDYGTPLLFPGFPNPKIAAVRDKRKNKKALHDSHAKPSIHPLRNRTINRPCPPKSRVIRPSWNPKTM